MFLLLSMMLACTKAASPEPIEKEGVTFSYMESESLPPMLHPRACFVLQEVNGDLLAIGGHTTGFLTTATAEIFHKGRWTEIPTLYPHDGAFSVPLKGGFVLVGGGYESSFGIGQTWGVEKFDPGTKSFSPMPILDRNRAHASALELPDGHLVISGNWFAPDAVERYRPDGEASHWQEVSEERSYPYIVPVGPEEIWVFGGNCGSRMQELLGTVDVVGGEPFIPELFQEWMPVSAYERNVTAGVYNIGPWTYLIPAVNGEGQLAAMKVSSEGFSLLEMDHPLPMQGPWGAIWYDGSFWVDLSSRTAWIVGQDMEKHVFLAAIDYGPALEGRKASFKMYYSKPLALLPRGSTELRMSDGRFAIVGGCITSNYEPSDAAFMLYPLGRPMKPIPGWPFVVLALLLLLGLWPLMKKQRQETAELPETPAFNGLRNRLVALMEVRQFYRKKGLKIADVATELGTNTTYISACLSGQMGTSFRSFVTEYRVAHAKRLMKEHPEMRLSQVADESGFSNEKTFLRTFKSITGLTPTEWKKGASFMISSK